MKVALLNNEGIHDQRVNRTAAADTAEAGRGRLVHEDVSTAKGRFGPSYPPVR